MASAAAHTCGATPRAPWPADIPRPLWSAGARHGGAGDGGVSLIPAHDAARDGRRVGWAEEPWGPSASRSGRHRGDGVPQAPRFVVIDATTVQAPGATGTDYRLHMRLDLVT